MIILGILFYSLSVLIFYNLCKASGKAERHVEYLKKSNKKK